MNSTASVSKSTISVLRFLHWTCAIIFIALVIATPIMIDFADGGEETTRAYMLHQSVGILFIIFVSIRFYLIYKAKGNATQTKSHFAFRWQYYAAKLFHVLLYVLMIFTPLSGVISKISDGDPLELFSLQLLPAMEQLISEDVNYYSAEIHLYLINIFYFLVIFHVLGALSHWLMHNIKPLNDYIQSRTKR